jgi:hypothetical protein
MLTLFDTRRTPRVSHREFAGYSVAAIFAVIVLVGLYALRTAA